MVSTSLTTASVAKEKLRSNLAGIQRYNQIENGRADLLHVRTTRNVQRLNACGATKTVN